jgi:hypothetical protein
MDPTIIVFISLHAICGVLAVIQLFYVAKEPRFRKYYTVLTLNLILQIVSIATILVAYPNDMKPFWMPFIETVLSHITIAAVFYLNLEVLQMFSFLFEFIKDWMIRTSKISAALYTVGLVIANIVLFVTVQDIRALRLALNYAVGPLSVITVAHDNIQSILILHKVYTVSKRRSDKKTRENTQKALVPAAVSTIIVIIMDWFFLLT